MDLAMIWVESRQWGWVLVDSWGECWWCGGPTNTLDVDFQGRLHMACALSAWRAFFTANRGVGEMVAELPW